MSNGTDLRVSRSLDLLNRLERTASEFATREEQLTQELRTSRYKANRKHSVAMQEVESRLDAIVNKLDERYGAEAQRIQALYKKRKDNVLKGQTLGIRNLPRKVENARGRWLGVLQMKRLRLEKEFGAGKQTAKHNFGETSKKLADQKAHLAEMESFTRHGFRGYGSFTSLLKPFSTNDAPPSGGDLEGELKAAEARLMEFQKFGLPKLFSSLPRFILIALILLGAATLAYFMGFGTTAFAVAGGLAGLLIITVVTLHAKGGRTALPAAQALAEILQKAKASHQAAVAEAEADHAQQRQSLQEHFDRESANLQAQWDQTDDVETKFASAARQKLEAQIPRLLAKIEQASTKRLTALDDLHRAEIQKFRVEAEAQLETIKAAQDAEMKVVTTAEEAQWQVVEEEWKRRMIPVYQGVDAMNAATAERFPDWQPAMGANWTPPTEFTAATKFAHLDLDLNASAELAPKDPKLALPGPGQVSIPLCLTFPHQGSLLFETNEPADATVGGIFNNIILRLLTTTPPGKLSFTIIDPVGLGTNFAGLMHLSDYEDSLISRRIWTQRDQIEERLEELSEHIEKVIQMYLRNEYATITEYNEQAGSVAEKYYFLVIADFPANFSETAAKKLQSIATSGPRCGIYTLIHWDQRHTLPDGCVADDLRQNSVSIHREKNEFFIHEDNRTTLSKLRFDQPPSAELALSLIHKIGKSSVDSNRVQVPFSQIAPKPGEEWTNETTNELRIAVGRTGATKLQYLAIGKGTKQHALFAGKTGSGKSTLFHVIITNLALTCSPDEVEFYLIDFKKGVEFKCYATKHLPHAKVVAIESDREFALSVLQRVDAELKRRGDMFRKLGVQDVAGYKRAGGTEPMPRSLLLIDEFQEFFVEDDTIAQSASLLFDRIVRQGRAFGIHVLLGSQTLGGAYSLARATLGQMVIRVALQCNEADAYLIMDENNSAPRLLSRPGEGIYNDSAGALEGNSPFQVVWLPDDERDQCLDKINDIAAKSGRKYSSPIVFEGNAPAEIRENELLRQTLATKPAKSPVSAKAWLGAPNSIKGPTEAAFSRQSGNHLLIVGQRDEAAVSMLGVSIVSLAAQFPEGKARFVVLQGSPQGSPDADFLDSILASVKQPVTVARGQEIAEAISELSAELKGRTSGEVDTSTAPSIFLIIHGLHKFKKLRQEDDFSFSMDDSSENTGSQFTTLISEGSSLGIHILTTVDSFNNVNRSMNRKALSEFEMRVVFQMSANDSASLIDSPKASTLGLHRALFYNEHDGTLETFRPYATPDAEWIREAAAQR